MVVDGSVSIQSLTAVTFWALLLVQGDSAVDPFTVENYMKALEEEAKASAAVKCYTTVCAAATRDIAFWCFTDVWRQWRLERRRGRHSERQPNHQPGPPRQGPLHLGLVQRQGLSQEGVYLHTPCQRCACYFLLQCNAIGFNTNYYCLVVSSLQR